METCLYASRIPRSASLSEVEKLFSQIGPVSKIDKHSGWALIEMSTPTDAATAIAKLDGQKWGDRTISVQYAHSRADWTPKTHEGRRYTTSGIRQQSLQVKRTKLNQCPSIGYCFREIFCSGDGQRRFIGSHFSEQNTKLLSSPDGGPNMQGHMPGRARRRAHGPSHRAEPIRSRCSSASRFPGA